MKYKPLLMFSLFANALLVVVLLTTHRRPPTPTPLETSTQKASQKAISSRKESGEIRPPVTLTKGFHWSSLEAADYREYITNLRNIQCPEETIKDLIICEISKLFTEKKQKAMQNMAPWAHTQPNAARQQALRALQQEERTLIRDLLGVDLLAEQQRLFGGFAIGATLQRLTLEWLPIEKQSTMRELLQKYDDLEKDLRITANNVLLKEDREKLRELKNQKRQALVSLLSPDELTAYDMRTSDTSAIISALPRNGFEYTEDEFKAIFSVYRDTDPYREFNIATAAETERAKKEDLEAQLERVLGPERYAQYRKANDPAYGAINRVISRMHLDQNKTDAIYQIKTTLDEANKRLAAANRSSDIVESQMREMREAAKEAVQHLIGESGYQMMIDNGSAWLK